MNFKLTFNINLERKVCSHHALQLCETVKRNENLLTWREHGLLYCCYIEFERKDLL